MNKKTHAYWLADKIPALGDYAKEAAFVLRRQADEIERMELAIGRACKCLQSNSGYDHFDELQSLASVIQHNEGHFPQSADAEDAARGAS